LVLNILTDNIAAESISGPAPRLIGFDPDNGCPMNLFPLVREPVLGDPKPTGTVARRYAPGPKHMEDTMLFLGAYLVVFKAVITELAFNSLTQPLMSIGELIGVASWAG